METSDPFFKKEAAQLFLNIQKETEMTQDHMMYAQNRSDTFQGENWNPHQPTNVFSSAMQSPNHNGNDTSIHITTATHAMITISTMTQICG
jgi:hypothetical protein